MCVLRCVCCHGDSGDPYGASNALGAYLTAITFGLKILEYNEVAPSVEGTVFSDADARATVTRWRALKPDVVLAGFANSDYCKLGSFFLALQWVPHGYGYSIFGGEGVIMVV